MNHPLRGLIPEPAPTRERATSGDQASSLSAGSAPGGLRCTLCGEYLAMLLTMNSGFSALIWILRLPGTVVAGGFLVICLWICVRSMGLRMQKSAAVPLSTAAVLLGGLMVANEWAECPTWLTWSPFSPLAITLMAAAVLLEDLAMKGEQTRREQYPAGRPS